MAMTRSEFSAIRLLADSTAGCRQMPGLLEGVRAPWNVVWLSSTQSRASSGFAFNRQGLSNVLKV